MDKRLFFRWISFGMALATLATPWNAEACRPFGSYELLEDKNGGIWFTEGDNNAISRLAPDGTVKSFAIPTEAAEAVSLAMDRKGNIWFAETDGRKIGKLSKKGAITEFPVAGGQPVQLTVDSKGEAWFTQMVGHQQEDSEDQREHASHSAGRSPPSQIGRITRKGQVLAYPLPEGRATSIVADNTDRVWVGILEPSPDPNNLSKRIGRIASLDRSGKWKIHVERENSCPMNVLSDSSGNIWFSDKCRGSIEMLGRTGSLTAFKLHPETFVQKMALDGKGNVWFADRVRNRLSRLSAAGKLEEYPLPTDNGGPFAVLASRKGALYFSEVYNYNLNKLSRDGTFEEYLINPNGRKNAQEAREGEVCYIKFAAQITDKQEQDKLRAEEVRISHLKESGDGTSKFVEQKCTLCHDTKRILLSRKTNWLYSINRMQEYMGIRKIPRLNPEEKEIVVHYLNTHYGIGR